MNTAHPHKLDSEYHDDDGNNHESSVPRRRAAKRRKRYPPVGPAGIWFQSQQQMLSGRQKQAKQHDSDRKDGNAAVENGRALDESQSSAMQHAASDAPANEDVTFCSPAWMCMQWSLNLCTPYLPAYLGSAQRYQQVRAHMPSNYVLLPQIHAGECDWKLAPAQRKLLVLIDSILPSLNDNTWQIKLKDETGESILAWIEPYFVKQEQEKHQPEYIQTGFAWCLINVTIMLVPREDTALQQVKGTLSAAATSVTATAAASTNNNNESEAVQDQEQQGQFERMLLISEENVEKVWTPKNAERDVTNEEFCTWMQKRRSLEETDFMQEEVAANLVANTIQNAPSQFEALQNDEGKEDEVQHMTPFQQEVICIEEELGEQNFTAATEIESLAPPMITPISKDLSKDLSVVKKSLMSTPLCTKAHDASPQKNLIEERNNGLIKKSNGKVQEKQKNQQAIQKSIENQEVPFEKCITATIEEKIQHNFTEISSKDASLDPEERNNTVKNILRAAHESELSYLSSQSPITDIHTRQDDDDKRRDVEVRLFSPHSESEKGNTSITVADTICTNTSTVLHTTAPSSHLGEKNTIITKSRKSLPSKKIKKSKEKKKMKKMKKVKKKEREKKQKQDSKASATISIVTPKSTKQKQQQQQQQSNCNMWMSEKEGNILNMLTEDDMNEKVFVDDNISIDHTRKHSNTVQSNQRTTATTPSQKIVINKNQNGMEQKSAPSLFQTSISRSGFDTIDDLLSDADE